MSTIDRIKQLCDSKGIAISQLEKNLGYGNGSIAKASSIKDDRVIEIAKYFQVSADYLLGMEEIEKNNSVVADATLKMIYDPELTSVVDKVAKLNEKQLVALKALLDAFLD